MQLLPPLLMQETLHCNPLLLKNVGAKEADNAVQHNHHAETQRKHAKKIH